MCHDVGCWHLEEEKTTDYTCLCQFYEKPKYYAGLPRLSSSLIRVKGDSHGMLIAMLYPCPAVLPFKNQGINDRSLVKLLALSGYWLMS